MRTEQNTISLTINGRPTRVRTGSSVAAAIMSTGAPCRISVSGQPRAALCGMGICMECRATVNGTPHVRTCQVMAVDGMTVVTG